MNDFRLRYLGGPTVLLEYGDLRLLVDPTFDPAGDYPIGERVLTKTANAVVGPSEVGPIDAVLLSHDQHPDNLDRAGRAFLERVPVILSTPDAESRLQSRVIGMAPWAEHRLGAVTVTAVPARHGPAGCEPYVGQVTGFMLGGSDLPRVYLSGDNAALELVHEISARFPQVDVAILFAGAARTPLMEYAPLTLTSEEAAMAARTLDAAHVVPVHFEDWAHFSEGRTTLAPAFAGLGLQDRLHLLGRGQWWSPDVSM